MASKNIVRGRAWLNPPTSNDTGSCQYSVDIDSHNGKIEGVDGNLTIKDCSRRVDLSFYAHNKRIMNQRITKINKLISHLERFRDGMLKAQKEFK